MPRLSRTVAHREDGFPEPSPPPTGAPPPKGEARLGSPSGGAGAVRRLRGQLASASTQPMRRGRWHLALSAPHRGAPPPKGEARLGSPSGGRYVPVGRCPAADRGGSRDAGAVRRLRGQAASLTIRSRGYRPYGRVRPGRWFLFRLTPIRSRSRARSKLF